MSYPEYILIALSFLSLTVVATHFTATFYTIFYQQYLYKWRVRSKFNPDYAPFCSIIIPVKGNSPSLAADIRPFFQQNYPHYEVLFTVESKNEPAIPTLREIVAQHKNSQLVIAKLSRNCCQKNQNILAALKQTSHPEVYVFADKSKLVDIHWLKELVMPLSSPKISATSTYYWPYTETGSLGEMTFTFMNIYIYTIYAYATNFLKTCLIWGGSIAIRKKTFEKLKVARYWSTTVVDDTSLSKLLTDNKHKTIIVPTALCQGTRSKSDQTLISSFDWFVRQVMYLKLYRRRLWFHIFGWIAIIHTFNYLLLVTSIIYTILNREVTPLIVIPIIFMLIDMFNSLFFIFLGPIKNFHRLVIFTPFIRFVQYLGYLKTYLTYTIVWGGIKYKLTRTGEVVQIKR